MANSPVGYIALLRQLASFCTGWVSDHCRDLSISNMAYMDSRGWGAPTPPVYVNYIYIYSLYNLHAGTEGFRRGLD